MATLEDVRRSLAILQAATAKAVIMASVKLSEGAKAHSMIEARADRLLTVSWTGRLNDRFWHMADIPMHR
jgi:hypothetical protein